MVTPKGGGGLSLFDTYFGGKNMDIEEIKAGTKTSEFWITLSPAILAIVDSGKDDPEIKKYLIIAGAILGGIYIISRTMIKCKFSNSGDAHKE